MCWTKELILFYNNDMWGKEKTQKADPKSNRSTNAQDHKTWFRRPFWLYNQIFWGKSWSQKTAPSGCLCAILGHEQSTKLEEFKEFKKNNELQTYANREEDLGCGVHTVHRKSKYHDDVDMAQKPCFKKYGPTWPRKERQDQNPDLWEL